MPAFVRLEFWTGLACQGPTRIGALYPRDLADARDVLAVEDQEGLTASFSRVDRSGQVRGLLASLTVRAIARIVWSDGSFDERRVASIEDGRGTDGLVTIVANPLILDLADGADSTAGAGFVSAVQSGIRVFDFATVERTASGLIDDYVIPACPSWVTKGTVDPITTLPELEWDRLTPLALLTLIRDSLRQRGESCEFRLRRNGTTDYKIDLVSAVGASATVPLFHPRTALRSLRRRTDSAEQATRVFVAGSDDPSGVPGILGRARWKVVSVNGGTKTLGLYDPNGGGFGGTIGFVDQLAGKWLLRVKTGRTFQIVSSDPGPTTAGAGFPTVTLSDVSDIAANELVEFRLTEPLTNDRTIASPSPRYAVSAVSGNDLTLSSNPITTDNQHKDWYARVWTASSGGSVVKSTRVTASVASTDVVTVESGTSVTTSHFVEFVQLDGAGEVPSYLDHPTYSAAPSSGYGIKCRDLPVDRASGVTQCVKNGWMRTWTTSSSPPDGWTRVGVGTPTSTRNSDPLYTRYGGFSLFANWVQNGFQLYTPRIDVPLAPGTTRVSARAQLFFVAVNVASGSPFFQMRLVPLDASGALGATTLASASIDPADIIVNAWTTLEIVGAEFAMHDAPYGFVALLEWANDLGLDTCDAYLDTVEAYNFAANPEAVYEHGDATTLWEAGNAHLALYGAPPVSYEVAIDDLERSDPTTWSRNALTLGGNVRVFDPDAGIDATVRLLRIDRALVRPKESTLVLANRPVVLSTIVQTR